MRRAARVDDNHAEIVAALRAAGATVQSLAAVGGGVPDLLIGWKGSNLLMEVKRTNKWDLTAAQAMWHFGWRGDVVVVTHAGEALEELRRWRGPR